MYKFILLSEVVLKIRSNWVQNFCLLYDQIIYFIICKFKTFLFLILYVNFPCYWC